MHRLLHSLVFHQKMHSLRHQSILPLQPHTLIWVTTTIHKPVYSVTKLSLFHLRLLSRQLANQEAVEASPLLVTALMASDDNHLSLVLKTGFLSRHLATSMSIKSDSCTRVQVSSLQHEGSERLACGRVRRKSALALRCHAEPRLRKPGFPLFLITKESCTTIWLSSTIRVDVLSPGHTLFSYIRPYFKRLSNTRPSKS